MEQFQIFQDQDLNDWESYLFIQNPDYNILSRPHLKSLPHQILYFLLHAEHCRRISETSPQLPRCTDARCSKVIRILQHYEKCQKNRDKNCRIEVCSRVKLVLNHWINCSNDVCSFCVLLEENSIFIRPSLGYHQTIVHQNSANLFQQVGSMFVDPMRSTNQQLNSLPVYPVESNSPFFVISPTRTDFPFVGTIETSPLPSSEINQVAHVNPVIQNSTVFPTEFKKWHSNIDGELRKNLENVMVDCLKGTLEYKTKLAWEIETRIFYESETKEEYYHKMAAELFLHRIPNKN